MFAGRRLRRSHRKNTRKQGAAKQFPAVSNTSDSLGIPEIKRFSGFSARTSYFAGTGHFNFAATYHVTAI
ncbi:hypothetical protein SS05631_a43490 (plasmid) [Sinorhizobium sp. CCBAU 05631]|nr:hypothetical protein SS05631_a43490 [Sinorhizobium sp. CCBAU 05631]ASY74097.1 hypothetical protein SF83666_a45090 [Sinorhizobium fredii CCBAU 83666]